MHLIRTVFHFSNTRALRFGIVDAPGCLPLATEYASLFRVLQYSSRRSRIAVRVLTHTSPKSLPARYIIYICIYIQTFAMLFNSIFGGGAPPNPIFFSTEMWWQARVLSEWSRFFLRAGKGSPPKSRLNIVVDIKNPELGAKEPICYKLQTARSPRFRKSCAVRFRERIDWGSKFCFLVFAVCYL